MITYVDGRVVPDGRVPVGDRGFLLGDGVFETLRVDGGHAFRLDAHMERLAHGLRAIGLGDGPVPEAREAVLALAVAAEQDPVLVRVNVTSGAFRGIDADPEPVVTGLLRPLAAPPPERYQSGSTVIVAGHRKDDASPLAAVKHMSYLPHVQARREARAAGAHDALIPNMAGRIAEGTFSNVFAAAGNTVHAPGPTEGALAGVTRDVVLEALGEEAMEVVDRLDLDTLRLADEAWLTNTSGGCVPVTRVAGVPIGDGTSGDLTRRLHDAYLAAVHEEAQA